MGPKRKHLDYLLQCTNEPNISIPQMANLLIERTQNASWVVVFKALVTVHNLMNYGNERFTQFLASNNCSFNLSGFTDKSGPQGYDMSAFVRRYSKYLNEKAFSYRQMAFDFCKVKRGKDDGLLRTMDTTKLLKALPVLQSQLDTLIEFDVSANELTNGVINAAFMLMFKDLIRLFACYNDGIINLLEKYFDMNKKNCKDALEIYKKFLARMDRVCEFLKVAENVGIDKGDIPDLAKAPSSLLEALEQHMNSLENTKKGGAVVTTKPTAGISAAISNYATASQVGAAPGAGIGTTSISDEERQRILEEEQRQLDQMKQQRMKQMAGSPAGSSTSSNTSSKMLASQPATTTSTTTSASATVTTKPMNDPFGSSAATAPTVSATVANHNKHSHIDDLLSLDNPIDQHQPQHSFFSQQQQPPFIQQPQLQQNLFASNSFMTPNQQHVFMPQATLTMLQTTASTTNSVIPALNPFAPQQAQQQPLLFSHLQSQPWGNVITSSRTFDAMARCTAYTSALMGTR
ncbi:hypothetical protein HELRODRAFT_192181 [Helobdella robusta]|uniref:ENTH domain-containing protein n=1 Tax=Helobdella robusta TaxID=6412 RepID=T1FTN7_HELRO|nr:hypothetical protein HELRODRAFT_192181 [Helobdella robusta]ESO01542.1 hypothetical protein HELRODRAFT_192181 [Helobdella robusta]